MAKTIVDQVKQLAQYLGQAARESRRIAVLPGGAVGPKRPEIDALDFRRRGV